LTREAKLNPTRIVLGAPRFGDKVFWGWHWGHMCPGSVWITLPPSGPETTTS